MLMCYSTPTVSHVLLSVAPPRLWTGRPRTLAQGGTPRQTSSVTPSRRVRCTSSSSTRTRARWGPGGRSSGSKDEFKLGCWGGWIPTLQLPPSLSLPPARRRGHAAVEADVRRAARPLPLPVQGQEGGPRPRQLPALRGAAAHLRPGVPHRHLLQRHQAQERAAAHHVRLRVSVPGRGQGGHAGLDQGDTGEQQPGRGGESRGSLLLQKVRLKCSPCRSQWICTF